MHVNDNKMTVITSTLYIDCDAISTDRGKISLQTFTQRKCCLTSLAHFQANEETLMNCQEVFAIFKM